MRTKLLRLRVGEERPGRTGNLWVFPSWLRVPSNGRNGLSEFICNPQTMGPESKYAVDPTKNLPNVNPPMMDC